MGIQTRNVVVSFFVYWVSALLACRSTDCMCGLISLAWTVQNQRMPPRHHSDHDCMDAGMLHTVADTLPACHIYSAAILIVGITDIDYNYFCAALRQCYLQATCVLIENIQMHINCQSWRGVSKLPILPKILLNCLSFLYL
jgi:hypothetical protein